MDDMLNESTNVVQFPSGRAGRPLMERVCDAEPDVREVLFAADSPGLALPAAGLRDCVDEETERHIAEQVLPLAPSERRLALDGLLAPVALAALRACADAAWASGRCAAALRDVEQARREGGHWLDPVEERAEALAREAGRLLVAAHGRCQEAHGVARAVGLARRGERWTPRDAAETAAWLAECGAAQGGVTAYGAGCPACHDALRCRCVSGAYLVNRTGAWPGRGTRRRHGRGGSQAAT